MTADTKTTIGRIPEAGEAGQVLGVGEARAMRPQAVRAVPRQPFVPSSSPTLGRFSLGPTGLGTSAARLPGTPADRPRPVPVTASASESGPASDSGAVAEQGPLRIPKFRFPWAPACHPDAESAEQGALEFAERFDLIPDEAYRARLVRARYGWFAARCYPDADRELLQILADYALWYYSADDLFVDRVETVNSRTIPNLTAMIDVLDHHRLGTEPVYGEHAWLDICTRLRRRLSHEHFQRFAHGMRMWASTAGLQIVNHLQQTSIDIPQYETIRRHTSGMNPCLDVADAAKAGPVTPDEFYDPEVQQLREHANNVVCWSNDVQSVSMEMNQPGQYRNMVVIYATQGLTLQQSVDLVAARVNAEIAAFQLLALNKNPAPARSCVA